MARPRSIAGDQLAVAADQVLVEIPSRGALAGPRVHVRPPVRTDAPSAPTLRPWSVSGKGHARQRLYRTPRSPPRTWAPARRNRWTGTPITTRPRLLASDSHSACSPSYCGVNPQEAVLTTSSTLPLPLAERRLCRPRWPRIRGRRPPSRRGSRSGCVSHSHQHGACQGRSHQVLMGTLHRSVDADTATISGRIAAASPARAHDRVIAALAGSG